MNMNQFLELPLIQNTNQAAYAAGLGLLIATVAWTVLRYCGRSFLSLADRRREIKLAEETRKRAKEDRDRGIRIEDDKRYREEEARKRSEEDARIELKKKVAEEQEAYERKMKEQEEARLTQRIVHAVQAATPQLLSTAADRVASVASSQLLPYATVSASPKNRLSFEAGRVARFVRDATNSSRAVSRHGHGERVAKAGDLIQVLGVRGDGLIIYEWREGMQNFAKPEDLEVIA